MKSAAHKLPKLALKALFWTAAAHLIVFGFVITGYAVIMNRQLLWKLLLAAALLQFALRAKHIRIPLAARWALLILCSSASCAFSPYFREISPSQCPAQSTGATPIITPAALHPALAPDSCTSRLRDPYDVYFDPLYRNLFIAEKTSLLTLHMPAATDKFTCAPNNLIRAQRLTPAANLIAAPGYTTPENFLIDTASARPLRTFTTGSSENIASAWDGADTLFIIGERRTVSTHSIKTGRTRSHHFPQLFNRLYAAAYSGKLHTLFITNWWPGYLYAIDTRTMRLTASKLLTPALMGIEIDASRGELYAASPLTSSVLVIDASTLEIKRKIPAGFGVRDIQLSTRRRILFTANYSDATVAATDIDTGARREIPSGPLPRGVYFDEQTGTLFFCSRCGVYRTQPLAGN